MLYEAVKDKLATLLAEASEVGRGLPRYVERDVSPVPGVRSAGARLGAGALREWQGRVSRRLLVQGTRGVSLLQREASACDGSAPGGAGTEVDVRLPARKQPRCAPSWRDSPCTPIRTCMRTTGRGWSGYAATEHAVRWHWSVCHERRMAALPTA
jgi:hypothetical protein